MAVDTSELMSHVKDATYFHLPNGTKEGLLLHLPQPCWLAEKIGMDEATVEWMRENLQFTKYMVLELVAAVLILAVFIPLARRIATGKPVKGRLGNFFEMLLLVIRDDLVRPSIGQKDADRFLPYVWTVFFFVLFCNLLGLIPCAGSPTGALACTSVLALMTFVIVLGTGLRRHGPIGFVKGLVPHMKLPFVVAIIVIPMVFVIEVCGLFIKHSVLSVRLFANMFAGHLVLAVIVGFIAMTVEHHVAVWSGVMITSILGATALCLLELLVALLQAYIFAFLSALFIGMAIHQH